MVKKPCDVNCPFFRCAQRALIRGRRGDKGRWHQTPSRPTPAASFSTPYCTWVRDVCEGSRCKYAFCERRLLLPDGYCGLAEAVPPKSISLERVAANLSKDFEGLKGKLKRKGLHDAL